MGPKISYSAPYLRGLPAQPLVDGSIRGYYKVNPNAATAECSHAYMQTPIGRMLMRYFYENNVTYEHNLVVMQQDFSYDYHAGLNEPIQYVTIDIPLINEFKMQPLVIFYRLQYAGGQDPKRSYTYMYFDKGGFFNVRQQFRLEPGFDKVNVQLAVRAGTLMPIEGRFFIGKIVVMFSDKSLDMNYNLMDDRSVDLVEDDSYLLKKGDFITVGGNKYLCHEEGYKCAGSVAFTKAAGSNIFYLSAPQGNMRRHPPARTFSAAGEERRYKAPSCSSSWRMARLMNSLIVVPALAAKAATRA